MSKEKRQAKKRAAEAKKQEKQRLEEEKLKKKQDKKAAKKNKPYRVHVDIRNRTLRIVIWGILVFFVLLGAFSFATREDSASIRRTLTQTVHDVNQISNNQEKASSFALAFIYDYFTFDPEMRDEYESKVNAYMADGVTLNSPASDVTMTTKTVALKGTEADASGNVDVTVQVNYETSGIMKIQTKVKDKKGKEDVKESEQAQTTTKTLDYKVAINVANNNCAVIAPPLLVTQDNSPQKVKAPDDFSGGEVTGTEKRAVSLLTENFLKSYYGKDASELMYFVTSDFGPTSTVGGEYSLKEIRECEVLHTNNRFKVEVSYVLTDKLLEQEQKAYLTVVLGEEGRYYVEKFSTRQ